MVSCGGFLSASIRCFRADFAVFLSNLEASLFQVQIYVKYKPFSWHTDHIFYAEYFGCLIFRQAEKLARIPRQRQKLFHVRREQDFRYVGENHWKELTSFFPRHSLGNIAIFSLCSSQSVVFTDI